MKHWSKATRTKKLTIWAAGIVATGLLAGTGYLLYKAYYDLENEKSHFFTQYKSAVTQVAAEEYHHMIDVISEEQVNYKTTAFSLGGAALISIGLSVWMYATIPEKPPKSTWIVPAISGKGIAVQFTW